MMTIGAETVKSMDQENKGNTTSGTDQAGVLGSDVQTRG